MSLKVKYIWILKISSWEPWCLSGKMFSGTINDSTLLFEFKKGRDSSVKMLSVIRNGKITEALKVMPHTREVVSFSHGGRTLKGALYLPAFGGKHPIVVFAHGSGPSTRGVAFFTTFFLQLGIGVLSFDNAPGFWDGLEKWLRERKIVQ